MKTKPEIFHQTEAYRLRLFTAISQKEEMGDECPGEVDLQILSLINKLEVLFWILDIELPTDDLMDLRLPLLQ